MKAPQAPRLERRRAKEFAAELQERAGAWIPSWAAADSEGDFGRALLEIAARFSSEVAERLDGAGEKMRRGFLDWLAVRGRAARPARVPVVFKLADTARSAVLADSPVRLQADADGTPVVFETEEDVRLIPGSLEVVVGVDADTDAFFLPPPGLSNLEPLESLPTRWQLKSFAASGATRFQLDPEAGLLADTIIESDGQQYRIVKADGDLVTIDRPLVNGISQGAVVKKITKFAPFDQATFNQQQHALYVGDAEMLNVKAAAMIEIIGASQLRDGVVWEYWGKIDGEDEVKWRPLSIEPDEQTVGGASVVLKKPKGEIVDREIGGKSGKWIRAFAKTVEPTAAPISVEEYTLRINSTVCDRQVQCPQISPTQSPEAEAMANTTPLVLDNVFFPLGKEPRQFDAFYLGSKEAFSKEGAEVQLCFEMADSNFAMLSALRIGDLANKILAGVAADGHLHLLSFEPATGRVGPLPNREPVRPPSPGPSGTTVTNPPVTLDRTQTFRAPMWTSGDETVIAVTAGATVWTWREHKTAPLQSGWTSLGEVGSIIDPSILIKGLVFLSEGAAAGRLLALRNSGLFIRNLSDPSASWMPIAAKDSVDNSLLFSNIAPIGIEGGDLGSGDFTKGVVGVASDNALYAISFSVNGAGDVITTCSKLLTDVATDVAPAAVRRGNNGPLIAVAIESPQANPRKVLAFLSTPGTFVKNKVKAQKLKWTDVSGGSIDVDVCNSQLIFAFCAKITEQLTALSVWAPFDQPHPDTLFDTLIPEQVGVTSRAPTLLPDYVLIPTKDSKVIVASFDPNLRSTFIAPLGAAVVTEARPDQLVLGDWIAYVVDVGGTATLKLTQVSKAGNQFRGRTYFDFGTPPIDTDLLVYKEGHSLEGSIPDTSHLNKMAIDPTDDNTDPRAILLIQTDKSTKLYNAVFASGIATLDPDLDVTDPSKKVAYTRPDESIEARVVPMLMPTGANANWDVAVLDTTSLRFEGAKPEFQRGSAFKVNGRRPELIALEEIWDTPPTILTGGVEFLVDAAVGSWTAQLGDTSSNPELSWEYWDGAGWSVLHPVRDETLNFKRTGIVKFTVPDDLRSGDWAGKKNFWIRARLIGGDYGKEKVTVKTKDLPDKVTEQTIDRSLAGIRPPSVLKLSLAYAVCKGAFPKFLLAEDSGTLRDQSDANRTPGAIVEAFVPLATTLERLSNGTTEFGEAGSDESPPECSRVSRLPGSGDHLSMVAPGAETASQVDAGRSIFLGLNATPTEGPVNVLFLVDEKKHSAFAPMVIDALIADRLEPLVAQDKTRALGETGILSMAFAVPPTRSELFGRENLTWLRLTPKANSSGEWLPSIRGAYLNSAWASATETLTRELLGSSNGEPDLTVRVARPPLLYKTLELRVREPLGDEEREELLKKNKDSVLSAVEGLPGDWVLWKQVVDPTDEPPSARVYSLDEKTGEIRFGDGRHGKIPPIGRDSIVAFRYSRTEPDPTGGDKVPGNAIAPRTQLNLVSPVESVERVVSADQAAGGAPPESDERVLRFGFARLRHRDRAVTAADIEDLALQSSPDIVQARAFVRRGYIRLVVVMAGKNPQPNGSQIRELRRLLLASAPASLSAPGALVIEGPKVRRLRIELELRIDRLDFAGDATAFVKTQVASFFDSASGGADGDGWPVGLSPNEGDIALALIDVPHLESIKEVKLVEVIGDGDSRPWPSAIKTSELVMPADDAVRIKFETAEVLV